MHNTLRYKRIVVKIGSNVLTRDNGTPDTTRISALVDQIAALHAAGAEIIMVSSGAVASGRGLLRNLGRRLDEVSARQIYSAVGQVRLIDRYYDLFGEYGIVCGQILTTKESLSTRRDYLNQRNCMETMLSCRVIPIVNENDAISVTELMFTDNDELSGLVAAMMDADLLIILSNIDGIYDGSPADPASRIIRSHAIYRHEAFVGGARRHDNQEPRSGTHGSRGYRDSHRKRPPRRHPYGHSHLRRRDAVYAIRTLGYPILDHKALDRQQRGLRQGCHRHKRGRCRGRSPQQGRQHTSRRGCRR